MRDWLINHWQEIAAYLGIGTSSGVLSKKYLDKKQNKVLKTHSYRLAKIENELKLNRSRDNDLRKEVENNRKQMEHWLDRVEQKIDKILMKRE